MTDAFLNGETVYLRPLRESDADGPYVSWLNDPDVCRFNSHRVFPYTRPAALDYIRGTLGNRQNLVLAVCLKENDRHIGNMSLSNIENQSSHAEYAVMMGEKDCWGKGYAKEAARLLLAHGFNALNLHRIYCGTSDENEAMQKLALYLGMQEEGRQREAHFKNGRYHDILLYGVLRQEFQARFPERLLNESAV